METPLEWWERAQMLLLLEWVDEHEPKYSALVREIVRQGFENPDSWRNLRASIKEKYNGEVFNKGKETG